MPSRTEGGLQPARQLPQQNAVYKPHENEVFNVLWEMKKNGREESTLNSTRKALLFIAKHSDLDNPEVVKGFIARLDRKNGYKKQLCFAYDNYVKVHKLEWTRPKYFVAQKLPKIPTEASLKMLIANASKKLALAISISKDTGMRPIEVMRLTPKDIDLQKKTIYPATAKHGSPRILKIKQTTLNHLIAYLADHDIGLNERLFGKWSSTKYGDYFRWSRDRLAKKLNNPALKGIRLYDLRHYYATMLYSRTRDILLVKQQMGHRKIETTLMYTQLFNAEDDQTFTCRTATNVKEASQLIENGFEFLAKNKKLRFTQH